MSGVGNPSTPASEPVENKLSETPRQGQNQDNQEDKSETAAWVISPACAVRPSRKSANQQKYQYHNVKQACEEKGYAVEEEVNEEDGSIRLVVRKWVSE